MRSTISKLFGRKSPTKILKDIALKGRKNMYTTAALKADKKPYDKKEAYKNIIKSKNNYVTYDKNNLTSSKAKKMLEDGKINGEPLTDKQKRYFGYIAGGNK
tara:strand:- start:10465 stop:10770 length:306 start_codon:yes stop_codon:yes gene_type:complete